MKPRPLFRYLFMYFFFLPLTICGIKEKNIVVLITSFNNEAWIEKSIDSILQQRYSHFRIIYIDDASRDTTANLAQQYIATHNNNNIPVTFIKNRTRQRKLKNIYNTIHSCDDHEIIVQVDGDDYLENPYALQRINQEYQNPHTWMTYGQYRVIPDEVAIKWNIQTCMPTSSAIIEQNSYRKNKWIYTHIRTFYAWLFKQIKLQDLITSRVPEFEGVFFPCCNDMATFWPMLEMANGRFAFIPDTLYVYNAGNPLAGFRNEYDLMIACSKEISTIQPYDALDYPIYNYLSSFDDALSDSIILSSGTPDILQNFLQTIPNTVSAAGNYLIMYQAFSKQQYDTYQSLLSTLAHTSVCIGNGTGVYVEQAIIAWLEQSHNKHCMICTDTTRLSSKTNLNSYIKHLEKTKAYCLYLNNSLLQNISMQHVYGSLYAWKYTPHPKHSKMIHSCDGTLYRHDTLIQLLRNTQSKTIAQFKKNMAYQTIPDRHSIGIIVDN